jgi:GT2 family glycosyltransferase
VIVVDNGSIDGSADAVRDFAKHARFAVELIQNETNRGFCAGNNQGILRASGEYVALLNNDAVASPQWVSSLLRAFAGGPDVGMAASKIVSFENPRIIDKAGHLIYPDGQNRGRGSGEVDCGQYDRVEEVLWPDGCAAMYRKSMLDEIGGFDEDLFAYGDDAELGLRARIAGWRCVYVPSAVVRHHRGATLGLQSRRRLELIERNRVLLAIKHFPLSLLWLNGFFFAARLLAGFWSGIRGQGEAARFPGIQGKFLIAAALVKGDFEAIAMIPSTLRKRRAMRPLRKLSSKQVRDLLFQYRIPLKALSDQAI